MLSIPTVQVYPSQITFWYQQLSMALSQNNHEVTSKTKVRGSKNVADLAFVLQSSKNFLSITFFSNYSSVFAYLECVFEPVWENRYVNFIMNYQVAAFQFVFNSCVSHCRKAYLTCL